MASGGSGWKDDKSGGSGSNWLLTGLKIGAAIGAAALGAYAAVKIAEQEKEEPMRSCDTGSGSSSDDSPHLGRQPHPHQSRPQAPGARPKPQRKASSNLMVDLNEFYDMRFNSSSDKQMAIQNFVGKTVQRISSYLMATHRRLIQGELTPAAIEGLYSREKQAEFNWMLPLVFDPKMWEFIDGAKTVLDTPGFFCVRRINLDFFPMGRSPWDNFLVGSYLCPELLVESWKKIIEGMIGERMVVEFYCNVTRRAGVVELNIENPVGNYAGMLCIKIIPCMQFKNHDGKMITITTQSVAHLQHPSSGQSKSGNPHENLWLQSREGEAVQKLEILDKDGGCRRKCLAILDALRWTRQPLRMFSSHVLMTVVLNLCNEETEWEEEMLAERFLDLLKALEGYLRAGSLKDHFNDQVDILSQSCSPGLIAESREWLAYTLESKERISGLLFD